MKKLLYLLLLITSISFGQTTLANKLKITGNATSTTATKVNVQETDGTVNTIAKTDLVDNIFVATVGDLPTTGVDGKIYVVKNVNKSYRWTGTFYQELSSTDLTGAVLTTGNQTKTGILSMTNPTGGGTNIAIINLGAGSDKYGLIATNNGSTNSEAIKSINNSTDAYGIHSDNNSSGVGLYSSNNSTGTGELIDNNSTGIGKLINNYSSGKSLVINNSTLATGIPLTVQKNGVNKATIDDSGKITADGSGLTGITESQVTNLVTDLGLKAPLGSPTFTGTPTAPTATVGTNTTQVATTAFVLANAASGAVLTTTNQSIIGKKTFINDDTNLGGIKVSANKTTGGVTYGDGAGIFVNGTGANYGILLDGTFSASIRSISVGSNLGIFSSNTGTVSYGFYSQNTSIGVGVYSRNDSSGIGMRLENLSAATGKPFQYLKAGNEKAYIDDAGNFSAQLILLKSYTVSTLPTGIQGAIAYVTDALAPTYMTTVVGGGTIITPVFYNGINWVAY